MRCVIVGFSLGEMKRRNINEWCDVQKSLKVLKQSKQSKQDKLLINLHDASNQLIVLR